MKNRLASLLFALVGLAALPTLAAAEPPARSLPVKDIEQRDRTVITLGTPEFTVRRLLGAATHKHDRNTWVYRNYRPRDWKIDAGDCSSLLISFVAGRVTQLALINDGAEKLIAIRRAPPAVSAAVAVK